MAPEPETPPSPAADKQTPLLAKHPALMSTPLLEVEVAEDVICKEPPETSIPSEVLNPPNVEPPVNDEVPASVERIVPPDIVRPRVDWRPLANMPELKVDVAPVPPTLISPPKVEVALIVSTVKTDVDAALITLKALAVFMKVWIVVEP